MQRRIGDQLVAVHDLAARVDREHAVAVAVEGETGVEAPVADALDQALDVRGPDARVDVPAVGVGRNRLHLGAEPAEDLRRDAVGRPVGAVQDDVEAAELQLGKARVQLAQVVLCGAPQLAHAPDARRRGGRGRPAALELALDRELGLVRELVAVGGEELDAVVGEGVV